MRQTNSDLALARGEKLQKEGAFRTYVAPTFRRRAGQQNWSEKIHVVASAGEQGRVTDTEGNSFRMSLVQPVPSTTQFVQVPEFAQPGSKKTDERRRQALQQWLPMFMERVYNAPNGLTLQQASRQTAGVPGFVQALRNQRATLLQFAQLWPDEIRFEKRGSQNVLFAKKPRIRPQEPQPAASVRVQEPPLSKGPQEPMSAAQTRVQEPPETREERNARLDALLARNRANVQVAQERAKERKLETLKQLRATQPRTERDLR